MGARRLAAAVALAAWAALLGGPAALAATSPSPVPSPEPQQMCQGLPLQDAERLVARLACDVAVGGPAAPVRDAQQSAGQAASQAGQAVAGAAETALTSWLANGAAWVVQGVSRKVMSSSASPSLDPAQASLFAHVYGRVVGVALSLSVLLVLAGILEATLTQRPGALRRLVTGIAVSGIGLGAVPVATAILVKITDDLSWYVAGDQSAIVAQGLDGVIHLLQQTSPAEGAAAFALAALGVMVGGALLWLELVTRESLIYLFLGVAPLACAAVQWPRLEGVLKQVLFGGLALILSKLVIAVALAVGFAVLAAGTGLESLLGGMFILLIAALMPFATARVLPLAAEELSLGHQGRLRGWATGGGRVGTTARVATAAATGGLGAAVSVLGLAPPMGHSGPYGPGPGPAGGAGSRPAPGGPRSSPQVAAAASAPGPPPSPPPVPPRRGPEPSRDASGPRPS